MSIHALPPRITGDAAEFDEPIPRSVNPTIPPFEGNKVDDLEAKLAGMSGLEFQTSHKVDQTARLLITGRVVGVNHRVDDKTGHLIRQEVFKVIDAIEVPFDALADVLDIDDRDPNR